MPPSFEGKPIRTVLRWQLTATAVAMSLAGLAWGLHGALSAGAGGIINVTAGAVFGWVAVRRRSDTPAGAVTALVKAEAVRLALIVAQFWLVLANYDGLLKAPFFGTFVLTVILFSLALFVRDKNVKHSTP